MDCVVGCSIRMSKYASSLICRDSLYTTLDEVYRFSQGELRDLVRRLHSVIMASGSDNTIKCYVGAYQRFERWTFKYPELTAYLAEPETVALYILALGQAGKSAAMISMANASVAWMHKAGGHMDPTADVLYLTVLEGVKRQQVMEVLHKKPLTSHIIADMRKSMIQQDNTITLSDYRLLLFVILAYLGFLRFQEASQIRRSHVADHRSHLNIFIPVSKTDQLRQGRREEVIVTGAASEAPMTYTSSGTFSMIEFPRPICCGLRTLHSTVRDLFRQCLAIIGLEPDEYWLHSM